MTNIHMTDSNKPNYLTIGLGSIGLQVTNQLFKRLNNASAKNETILMSGIEPVKPGCEACFEVSGMARAKRQNYALAQQVGFIQADVLKVTASQIQRYTHITIIVTPDEYDAENYKKTYLGIATHIAQMADDLTNLKRLVFISSTGVYGQNSGEWIDETVDPITPERKGSRYILQAENVLRNAFGTRAVIIRPSGVYGQDRRMRIRQAQEENKQPLPSHAWTNRIMDLDLVSIITNVLTLHDDKKIKPVYIATDYAPVTSYDLLKWLSRRLNSESPTLDEATSDNSVTHTPKMTGKRLHSNIPRAWLTFPDWQSGYESILSDSHLHM